MLSECPARASVRSVPSSSEAQTALLCLPVVITSFFRNKNSSVLCPCVPWRCQSGDPRFLSSEEKPGSRSQACECQVALVWSTRSRVAISRTGRRLVGRHLDGTRRGALPDVLRQCFALCAPLLPWQDLARDQLPHGLALIKLWVVQISWATGSRLSRAFSWTTRIAAVGGSRRDQERSGMTQRHRCRVLHRVILKV